MISGDNAVSVGAVADRLGLHGEAMDARALPTGREELADTLDSYTSFGRVRPDQKRAIVHALQSHGHTVAMTGDGVNDVLASRTLISVWRWARAARPRVRWHRSCC